MQTLQGFLKVGLKTVQYTVTAVLDTGSICDHQASNRTVTQILNAITERVRAVPVRMRETDGSSNNNNSVTRNKF
jgi:hypothetical protein